MEAYLKDKKLMAVIYAILAAVFYAINTPISKLLLDHVPSVFMASFLYFGAGIGVGFMYSFNRNRIKEEKLEKKDLPYTLGMIILDIAAPIFLMIGIRLGNASDASLLGNFEIVATAMIALLLFKEKVSRKLWMAIALITVSSIILSVDGKSEFSFSYGSIFVLLATLCWGMENNCTRSISDKSTYEIVTLKGLGSGTGSYVVALVMGEKLPEAKYIFFAGVLGFVAYGLSIFTYIRAQRYLGAAKTSAFYAIAPFIGAALAFALLGDELTWKYLIALIIMIVGTTFVVSDSLVQTHSHVHSHLIRHTHDGYTHTHLIEHGHTHRHIGDSERHEHGADKSFEESEEHLLDHKRRLSKKEDED